MQELWLQGLEWNDPLEELLKRRLSVTCKREPSQTKIKL